MFPRVRYQYQLKGCWSSVELCLEPELTSYSDQPVGYSAYPQRSFLAKLLTPKGSGSFILEILTNRSHWVNLRSLISPCFAVIVYNETWWSMLNIHLSYNPTTSWRILFHSGGCPRQFSRLKKFRALVVPGGGWHKGIILQWRQLKCRFSCGRQVMPEKKRRCNRSVCKSTQTKE